eukprot:scaffold10356_cov61-Phaeocystis_antarctica.AAC.2
MPNHPSFDLPQDGGWTAVVIVLVGQLKYRLRRHIVHVEVGDRRGAQGLRVTGHVVLPPVPARLERLPAVGAEALCDHVEPLCGRLLLRRVDLRDHVQRHLHEELLRQLLQHRDALQPIAVELPRHCRLERVREVGEDALPARRALPIDELVYWYIGALAHRCIGASVHWYITRHSLTS